MTFSDLLSHLFLPQESNNHKAKFLHPQILLFFSVFILFFGFSLKVIHKVAPNILGIATNISVNDLLVLTNQKREQAGLSPLRLNNQLSSAAYAKANDMFQNNYWAHFSPKGSTPWEFIVNSGYKYSFAGENLAKDFNDSTGVVNAWMASPTHKDNIMKSEYKDIGFAVVNGKLNGQETTLVVQMFGSSSSPVVAANNNVQPEAKGETTIPNTISPTIPTITPIIPTVFITQNPLPNVVVAGVKENPLIDLTKLNQWLSILIISLLLIVLVLDGYLIWERKTIRISGHNFSHIIFFAALMTVIWLSARGSIL